MGKKKSKKTVEVGTTVELDANTSENSKNNKMSKKSKKDAKGANELIAKLVDRKVNRDTMYDLVKSEKVFAKERDELLEIVNAMTLKSRMLKHFDPDQVKEARKALPPIVRKPKEDPLVKEIKEAKKVKQLKAIAREHGKWNWKKLKKLEFDEMQKVMLDIFVDETKPKPAAPKKVPNPLYAEIDGFTKTKKLIKWASKKEEFESLKLKKLKKEDVEEVQTILKDAIPEEIEKKPLVRKKIEGKHGTVSQAEFIRSLIRKELKRKKLIKELAKEYNQTEAWATSRFKTYEGARGKMGKNDAKL